jgi:hypothetical protein
VTSLLSTESDSEGSEGRTCSAADIRVFDNTNADDDATRKPRRSIFILGDFNTSV